MEEKRILTQQDIHAIIAKRELEKRKIKDDRVYFFENYVYIENKDGKSVKDRSILFKLFPEQLRALDEIVRNRLNIIIKARQLGMTWLVLSYAVHESICTEQYTVAILSQTEDYMHEAIDRVKYILERLPKWYMREYNKDNKVNDSVYLYEAFSDSITIYFPVNSDGIRETSSIKGFVSTEKAGRSITADLILFDEWAYHEDAEKVFGAAFPTINRPDSGKFVGLSSNKRGSYFESIVIDCIDEAKMGFNLIFLNVFADPRRTYEWYEQTKATLPNTWMQEYPETIEQALSAGDLTAFPEFSPSIHVCKPFTIPNHWIKYAAVDNGLRDPFCWFKLAISEDGTTYVYYEYTKEKKDPIVYYSDQAEKFMRSCVRDVSEETKQEIDELNLGYDTNNVTKYTKENLQYVIFGLDAFSTDRAKGTNKSLLDFYKEGGFDYPAVRATANRQLSKSAVHEYLKPYNDEASKIEGIPKAKLQIFDTCKFLIKYIPMLVVEDDNPNIVAGNSKIDNVYDCLAYGLIGSPRNNTKPLSEKENILAKFKKQKIKLLGKKRRVSGVIN